LVKPKRKPKAKPGKRRRPAVLETITVTVTDASSFRTAIVIR
jgi:hypothetical protein